jgi:lipid-A-disaccharide synthase
MTKIFVIAGEASGDLLGADLVQGLKASDPSIEIYGIGGQQLLNAGLPESVFPMEELSVMGVAEIIPKIPQMLLRINQTVAAIESIKPDMVVSIDSPDFSFRVQKKVRAKGLKVKQYHYVAPTVWAWREGRAAKISKFLDGILCLFPFEPAYFERVGLKAFYVGHPVIERYARSIPREEARRAFEYGEKDDVLGLLLGSRRGEVTKHADIFLPAIKKVLTPQTKVLVPTLPHVRPLVEQAIFSHFGDTDQFKIVSNPSIQTTYFKAMDRALAVSGTVGLELAVAGVPHIVAYKANALTAKIIKMMVKVKYAHLANIILDKAVVPECIQETCNSDMLSSCLNSLDSVAQRKEFEKLISALQTPNSSSDTILNVLR